MPRCLAGRGRVGPMGWFHRPSRPRRLRRRSNRRGTVPATAVIAGAHGRGQTTRRAPATGSPGGCVAKRPRRVPAAPPIGLARQGTLRWRHREAWRWVQRNPLSNSFPTRHHAWRAPVRGKIVGPCPTINGPVATTTACGTPAARPRDGRAGGRRRLLAASKRGWCATRRYKPRVPKPPGVHCWHRQTDGQRSGTTANDAR